MTDPTQPIPSDARIIAIAGVEPQDIVVQALEAAEKALVAQLGRPDVEEYLASGIFTFLNGAIPVVGANPIAQGLESFVLHLIANRKAATP